MPLDFLTQAERQRYQQLPAAIPERDLRQHFHLSEADRAFVATFRGVTSRLGMALHLGLLRYLGYLPDAWAVNVPAEVRAFVAGQLPDGAQIDLAGYGSREATRTAHLQAVLKHLGWSKWTPLEQGWLEPWLLERALEHDNERLLLDLACQKLRQHRLLRPAIGTLERLVGSLAEQAHRESFRRLRPLLDQPGLLATLDALLIPDDTPAALTRHRWLCQAATTASPRDLTQALAKLAFLQQLGVPAWDTSSLHINRQKRLARLVRARRNSYLQRLSPEKRYPALVAFLRESLLSLTDAVVELFDQYWEGATAKARRDLDAYQQRMAAAKDQALLTLGKAARLVVAEDDVPGPALRATIYEALSREALLTALEVSRALLQPSRHSHLAFLAERYGSVKQFSGQLLAQLHFAHAYQGDDFAQALTLVADLQAGRRRKLPVDLPQAFLTPTWARFVRAAEAGDAPGGHRQAYELGVLTTLRERLRSGDVYLPHSRQYAPLESYLLPVDEWVRVRTEACQQLNLPAQPLERIAQRITELQLLLPQVEALLGSGHESYLDEAAGRLVVPRLQAEELPASVTALQEEITRRLPRVELTDLLVEVDGWTQFAAHLQPLEGSAPRQAQHATLRYASLLALGCTIPLTDMAQSTGLDYQALWWTARSCLREETLRPATTQLVNYQHRQWLAAYWGNGTLSSSDGQRFPVSGAVRNARALPKYFGYGRGVTFYTHTADQYAQYGSQVIATTERDATYVLDEILDNETELEILEHTTDTAGYTDLVFALFDLLGLEFTPRLRDIADQKLSKIKGLDVTYPALKFTGQVNPAYLARHWEELLRVAGSLKLGYVTASLFIRKLQAYPRQHQLTYGLQEYGRLVKTIFILRYLLHQPLRRKINTQLNKGEQLHALRSWLWFGGDGVLRRKQEEAQQEVVGCLNLLTNAVVVWNTVYMQEVITQLRAEGYPVQEEDLVHLSPARFEHINRLGKYSFADQQALLNNGLRPLRRPEQAFITAASPA